MPAGGAQAIINLSLAGVQAPRVNTQPRAASAGALFSLIAHDGDWRRRLGDDDD